MSRRLTVINLYRNWGNTHTDSSSLLMFITASRDMFVSQYWSFISNRHLSDDLIGLERIKSRVLNQYAFLISTFFLIDALRELCLGYQLPALFLLILGINLQLLFFFTKVHFNDQFFFLVLLVCSTLVLVFSSNRGGESGIYFYYFAILQAIIFIFNERTNYIYGLILIIVIFFFFYLTEIRDLQVLNSEIQKSPKSSKATRIHTFIQIVCFVGFNAYLLVSKNKEISRLLSQKERSEKIIEQLNHKLSHISSTAQLEKLINLAMENSTLFIPLFKEVFPAIYFTLFTINPAMTSEEFKLFALIKLGFTTKDIATYTHLAVRTVQTKKNRLRKSFHISSQEDLYLWIEKVS